MQKQTIFIGNIPLMTSQGTFIINGIYRTVINQILQNPGIYYRSRLDREGNSVYTATIISDCGGRIKLEMKWSLFHFRSKRGIPDMYLYSYMTRTRTFDTHLHIFGWVYKLQRT
jgi:DNA-directed RNA polymerase beta subunit